MTLTIELPDEAGRDLQALTPKQDEMLHAAIRRLVTTEAKRFAAMTPGEWHEFEDIHAAVEDSYAQFQRGEYMTLDEAWERMQDEARHIFCRGHERPPLCAFGVSVLRTR